MKKIKLVCFDVDGTLVDGNSWLWLTEGLGCSRSKHLNIFRRAKTGEISFTEAERLLTQLYQNSRRATRGSINKLFAQVKPRPGAKELVIYLKEKGYLVYLISGAIDIYVENIAKKLGVDGYAANSTLKFNSDGILQSLFYRSNQGELKADQLNLLLDKLDLNLKEVVFVGDSENDLEVFKKTGRGIAVSSREKDLLKAAWKTVGSLEEIKQIL